MTLRNRLWNVVEPHKNGNPLGRAFEVFMLTLISLNIVAVIIGSIQSVADRYETLLWDFEIFSIAVFTAEYIARMWACTVDPRFAQPLWGRLKLARQPMVVADLLSVLPFYLPFVGLDLRIVRVLRLLRLVRVVKLGRYSVSLALVGEVVRKKREELIVTGVVLLMLLVVASSLIFYAEHDAQPAAFPNIPEAMWWSVATLTTIGAGSIFPITVMGKAIAALIALLGIGMFALPTGIIGAGFVEAINARKQGPRRCPHCGEIIE